MVKKYSLKKKIAISVIASIVLSGSLYANNVDILNNFKQDFSNLNQTMDLTKYGQLSKYKIGDVSLEDFIKVRVSENKAEEIVNNAVENFKEFETNKEQDKAVKKPLEDIRNRLDELNNQKLKNSNTFSKIVVNNAKQVYGSAKGAISAVKLTAPLLKSFKIVKNSLKVVKKADNLIEKTNNFKEKMNIAQSLNLLIEPMVKNKSIDINDREDFIKNLVNIKASLESINNSNNGVGGSMKNVIELTDAIDNIIVQQKILDNIDNMKNDGLLSERAVYILKNKIDNDLYGNMYNALSKSIRIAGDIGIASIASDTLADTIDELTTIRNSFTDVQDTNIVQSFKDLYDTRKERKNNLIIVAGRMNTVVDRLEYYEEKEDNNKQTLDKLAKNDKEVKDKIKLIQDQNDELQSKKDELERINDSKRDAFEDLKTLEKGSSEYDYAKNRFFNLSKDYTNLKDEISILTNDLNNNNDTLVTLQMQNYDLMSQIDDTTKDYTDDLKIDVAEQSLVSTVKYENYRGFITANIESKYYGTYADGSSIYDPRLRYWGGNFGLDIDDEPGGMELVVDPDTGKLVSLYASHGHNTSMDNTKDFSILANDISTDSSFYDPNIKTLKIENKDYTTSFISYTTDDYNYTAWGTWSVNAGLKTLINDGYGEEHIARNNNWVAGIPTKDLPAQGSAVYSGIVDGNWYEPAELNELPRYGGKIDGTVLMAVDFENKSIIFGSMTLNKQNGSNFANATMDNMQINTNYSSFQGKLIGANVRPNPNEYENNINGIFYGPNADEIGGIWNVTNTNDEFASGVFAGKK